jgi:hypothetical protein
MKSNQVKLIIAVIGICAVLIFIRGRLTDEKKISEGGNEVSNKPVLTSVRENKFSEEKKKTSPAVKKFSPPAVVENVPKEENTDEEIAEINEKIEAMEEKFDWDNERTAQITKNVLLGTPYPIRKYAYEVVTISIENNLKNSEADVVDLEMIYTAMEETVPPDMPWMKELIRDYIDDFE